MQNIRLIQEQNRRRFSHRGLNYTFGKPGPDPAYRAVSAPASRRPRTIPAGAVPLDAAIGCGLPEPKNWRRGISGGKGSPSAHTAPSSKYSFFQIGTLHLSVSISQRQASKAAARCADATAISTLVSPMCRRPRRCTIGHVANLKSAERFSCQRFHLLQRHLLVRFVIQVERLTAARLVPHDSLKNQRSAIFSPLEGLENLRSLDRLASDGA